jgi:hypothetical protein
MMGTHRMVLIWMAMWIGNGTVTMNRRNMNRRKMRRWRRWIRMWRRIRMRMMAKNLGRLARERW